MQERHLAIGKNQGGEFLVYESPDGGITVDVRLERETVWLSLSQMSELFGRHKSVISRHLANVFRSRELDRGTTVAKNATVQREGDREVERDVEYFNLDAILSVGYRVNSKRGTHFRIWATRTLREHLLRGYTFNERRLRERGLGDVEQALGLLAKTLTAHALVSDQARAVLDVVQRYTRTWRLLVEFDEERLPWAPYRPVAPAAALSLADARRAIADLKASITGRGEGGLLFGRESRDGLAAALGSVEQTFDAKALYPSVQSRAAHLLYFSSRTTRSSTATNPSGRCSSSTTCDATECSCGRMVRCVSRTMRWSRWLCCSRKAIACRRIS
jgi:hypothetical protein